MHTATSRRLSIAAAICAVAAPMAMQALMPDPAPLPRIEPQIPAASRTAPGRVFLEHADRLNKTTSDSFLVLTGNVRFSRGEIGRAHV